MLTSALEEEPFRKAEEGQHRLSDYATLSWTEALCWSSTARDLTLTPDFSSIWLTWNVNDAHLMVSSSAKIQTNNLVIVFGCLQLEWWGIEDEMSSLRLFAKVSKRAVHNCKKLRTWTGCFALKFIKISLKVCPQQNIISILVSHLFTAHNYLNKSWLTLSLSL